MRPTFLTTTVVGISLAYSAAAAHAATTFLGAPADEFVFYVDPEPPMNDEGPPASMLGLPNGTHVDLDGGGTTVRFADILQTFDYSPAEIPVQADLIIVGVGNLDIPLFVGFGNGNPQDANSDGVADVVDGTAVLVGTAAGLTYPWTLPGNTTNLLFYDLPGSVLVTQQFFVTIDGDDLEIDAVQLNRIPEPSAFALGGLALCAFAIWARAARRSRRH
jgi:hypothetical protein